MTPHVVIHFIWITHVVEAQTDMLRANQLCCVIDMLEERCGRVVVLTEEEADAVEIDHTVFGGTGAHQIIGYIALMVPYRARVRVGENHWPARVVDGLACRPISRV